MGSSGSRRQHAEASTRTTSLPNVDDRTRSDAVIAWGNEVAAGCDRPTLRVAQVCVWLVRNALECTWHDQGWGNQKGMIFARNPGGAWRALAPSVAPHDSTRLSVDIPPELRGERVQFGYGTGIAWVEGADTPSRQQPLLCGTGSLQHPLSVGRTRSWP